MKAKQYRHNTLLSGGYNVYLEQGAPGDPPSIFICDDGGTVVAELLDNLELEEGGNPNCLDDWAIGPVASRLISRIDYPFGEER